MGLKFIVAEAQARSTQASQVSGQAQQAVSSLQQSIQKFLAAPLSGKAYESAKNYFMVAYTPICQSIIMTAEAFARAHQKFLSEYQATVGGIDMDEDKIQAEIAQYQQLLHTIDTLIRESKTPRPDLERRGMNAYEAMQKRQEKLEKLRAYSARSASFFSDYESSQQELNRGLAQVKNCKAWNASTGTFDSKRLDMSWAKPIRARWDNRAKKMAEEHANKFEKAMKGRQYVRVQLAPGAYEWMWVKDPQKVSQADFEFNETYKDLLVILMNPKKNGLVDDYFTTMAEELRTGIHAKTGKPLTNLEKAQRWSTVLSAISVLAIGTYYGSKGLTVPTEEAPILKGNKNGTNYTLDRRKSTGDFSYKKASGASRPPRNLIDNMDEIANDIRNINKKYSSGLEQNNSIDSIINSASYYEDAWEQTSAVTRSVAEHAFVDGNKRTAFDTLNMLLDDLRLKSPLNDTQKWDLINRIGTGDLKDVSEIANILKGK